MENHLNLSTNHPHIYKQTKCLQVCRNHRLYGQIASKLDLKYFEVMTPETEF